MINGAHTIVYSQDADADRAFFRDVLGFPAVDAGGGWLLFALPPSELAVHPAEGPSHELFFLCDDLAETMAELKVQGVALADITQERWGVLTYLTLPGGGRVGLYEPRHPRAHA
jgi:catechol 2,3-dioxygenase-like lactoylglutathione lyase family enzyme